jgi:hypothetical protein
MLFIIMCWTRESPTESTNRTVAVILLYTKIMYANSGPAPVAASMSVQGHVFMLLQLAG